MKRLHRHRRHPSGAIALLTIVTISAFTLAIVTAVSVIATSLISNATTHRTTEQVFFAAESGLHDGLFRLGINPGAQTYSLPPANGITTVVTVTIDPADPLGHDRIITAVAQGHNIQRTLQVQATTSAWASGFLNAVQSGPGGVDMENESQIRGNLYANGTVEGKNGATVIGEVTSSGGAGSISGITVGAPSDPGATVKCPAPPPDPSASTHAVRAQSMANIDFYGTAHYRSVTGNTVEDVGAVPNDVCSNNENGVNCKDLDSTGGSDPTPTQYPITAQQVQAFKDAADDVQTGSVTLAINETRTLPSQKIVGDLTLGNGSTLLVTGPIWVTGQLITNPGVTIRLPASAGEASGVILFDQSVTVSNNATLQGSGNAKSFLLIVGLLNTPGPAAIVGSNNSTSVIYFAPGVNNGVIEVSNNAVLNNTTGHRVVLKQNACVQYNPNLTGFFIPSATPQLLLVQPSSWQEL